MPVPRNEREAIRMLADMVGDIAYRCWENLGTDMSARIQRQANVIAEAFRD